MEAPEPSPGTILVQRFHVQVPLALVRGRTDDFAQTKLRLRITIQDAFLRALFIVDHKLNSNARAAWPLGVGRHSPVSHEVARVRGRRRPASARCSAHANRAALHAATHWRPRRGAHCITGWVRQAPGMTAGRASLTLPAVSSQAACSTWPGGHLLRVPLPASLGEFSRDSPTRCSEGRRRPVGVRQRTKPTSSMVLKTAAVALFALAACSSPQPAATSLQEQVGDTATVCAHLPLGGIARGLPQMCLDLELAGGDACRRELYLGLRFNNSAAHITRQPLNLTGSGTCVNATVLAERAPELHQACGPDGILCIDFMNVGGLSSLTLDLDSAAGCPSISLHACSGESPEAGQGHQTPMPCFTLGSDCSQHTDCGACIGNGCGWCSAGYSAAHACKAGDPAGAACAVCGNETCGCDWHYSSCPVDADVLEAADARLNWTIAQTRDTQKRFDKLKAQVASGALIDPPNETGEFHCVLTSKIRQDSSAHTTLTALLGLAMALVGGVVGVVLGKAGYWDMIVTYSRRDDDAPMLDPRSAVVPDI